MTFDAVQEEVKGIIRALQRASFDREKKSLIEKIRDAAASEKSLLLEDYQELLAREAKEFLIL
jgi:hypothetical protein